MKLMFVLVLATATVITSLKAERRVWCDCRLNQVNFKQVDISCAYKRRNPQQSEDDSNVACSKEITGLVPRGYEYVDGAGFFKLFRTSTTYEKAQTRCEQDGGFLAVPNSTADAQAIAAILRKNGAVYEAMIGINDLKNTGRFMTVHGTPIESLGYQRWNAGQPDNSGPVGEHCVTINFDALYNDNRCDWMFVFVCQRALPFTLPKGYKYVPQLGFYKHYNTPDTYEGAKKQCVDDGGHLAVLDTQEEADEIIKYYDIDSYVNQSYVGINDLAQEGTFVTETGKLLTSLPFSNWYPGEPSNGAGHGEDCVTFHVGGTYNDVVCGLIFPFFCEIPLPSI